MVPHLSGTAGIATEIGNRRAVYENGTYSAAICENGTVAPIVTMNVISE